MLSSQRAETSNSNPFKNLSASLLAFMNHPNNTLNALTQILEQPKDEHGNIWIGIDNKDFSLWKNALEHIVPTKIFGPILLPTNVKVINKILSHLKIGDTAPFNGNRSTEVIGDLVGKENIFAATDPKVHTKHKIQFKDFIHDHKENAKKVAPVIEQWIKTHLQEKQFIKEQDIEQLAAQIMLTFLLNPSAANNPSLVKSVINLKTHFIKNATMQEAQVMGFFNGYEKAKKKLTNKISHLYETEASYPKILADNGYSINETISHILSLLMVGFDNLQSSLMSLLMKLSEHPEYRDYLKKEIISVNGIDFLQFDLGNQINTFSQHFFMEALRLGPPVWLQARKNKDEQKIVYADENGEEKSFDLPAATMVMIPNFQLAREMQKGNEFLPEREFKDFHYPIPFSTGPNACPGRNIAYAANGVLIAAIVNQNLNLSLNSVPKADPSVALKWKNIKLSLGDHEGVELKEETQTMWNPSAMKQSAKIGVTASVLSYLNNQDPLFSLGAGVATAACAMNQLNTVDDEENRPSPKVFR